MSRLKYWFVAPELMHTHEPGDGLFRYVIAQGAPLSLKEIADAIGFEWQEIAQLNWGTDDPEEISWYVEYYLKGTAIPPDDSDLPDPGVFDPEAPLPEGGEIVLPEPFEQEPPALLLASVPVSRYASS